MRLQTRFCTLALALVLSLALTGEAVAQDADAPPQPFESSTVALQATANTATALAMTWGGIILITSSGWGATHTGSTDERQLAGGIGLVGAVPLVVPAMTNLIGDLRGYSSPSRGAYIGSLVGTAGGAGIGAATRHPAPVAGLGMLGAIVGSAVGFHLFSPDPGDQVAEPATTTPTPFIAPSTRFDTDDESVSVGLRGRF